MVASSSSASPLCRYLVIVRITGRSAEAFFFPLKSRMFFKAEEYVSGSVCLECGIFNRKGCV